MTTALYSSISALCWSVGLLFIMQSFVALILTNVFRSEYLLQDALNDEQKTALFEYFGTYARSMLSTFELMLANWPPICRFLTENIHEGWMVVVIAYKMSFGFAFISVINAVFMQETLNIAVTDDNIMIRTKLRNMAGFRRKMEKLLKLADVNHDGFLSLAEFKAVLYNPGVKTWLEAMDMETRDGTLLFRLLDKNGDDRLSVDELVSGFSKVKGAAKSLDVQLLVQTLRRQWFPGVGAEDGDEVLIDGVSCVLRPECYTASSPDSIYSDDRVKFGNWYKGPIADELRGA
jgi:Ca2+-binding EF-hand superfamily protein